MHILVTGGAGYIGSHTVLQLLEAGHSVVVVDDFRNASPRVVERLETLAGRTIPVHRFDLADRAALDALFDAEPFDAVIHFAGLKSVGESVAHPLDYYENNLGSTFALLRAMEAHDVRHLVFSSSASVYGPQTPPYTEDTPTKAVNPYANTKVMIEEILRDVAASDDRWRIALLRYFNPVGAHPSGLIGEEPSGIPNNLVPFIAQVAVGRREKLLVFGDDYDTPDGTARRDYIHVDDLAAGHLAALRRITGSDEPLATWNLGTGRSLSVLEVLHAFEKAVGRELPYEVVARRAGDAPDSEADPTKAEQELGWRATRSFDEACVDHWRWQRQNPYGFGDAPSEA